ncbi:hypothetical protein FXN65_06930 [Metapseudomonas lalkuanensis]|uniref:Uncharacterized protein n=1 Tax=Metapseudomonas lalkuanensis TaxID=2604832 RepID=A0A5J6QHF5_9GAMM|nr:hypothetical protein [Pseudomonas lalkuanensis]QEY61803.1 hypothetical protein FXN65_06930 [Pseudomonas lalkuanensis]UCO99587.1 hypothetical protein LF844_07195 [Pseudomonas lalkuanensis]
MGCPTPHQSLLAALPLGLVRAARRAPGVAPTVQFSRKWAIHLLISLPLELAFWALWHCRHARPPDSARV